MKLNQIAGMNLHYMRYPLGYFLDSMERLEITSIELWGGFPHFYAEDMSLSNANSLKKNLIDRGIKLVCYTPEQIMYANNIASADADVLERSMVYYEKNIELAASLESKYMLITAGTGPYNEPTGSYREIAQQSLAQLASAAETLGVILLLEPLQLFESNLVNTSVELKNMLDVIGSPNIKGMLDLVGMHANKETISDYMENLGEIVHVHVVDGSPSGHLIPGSGQLPLDEYIKEIDSLGYKGYYSLELCSSAYFKNPHRAAAESINYLKKTFTQEK